MLIPLVLAGYARYLKGIDDNGQPFEISPDPLLAELQAIVSPLQVKEGEQDFSCLKKLYSRVWAKRSRAWSRSCTPVTAQCARPCTSTLSPAKML